VLSSARESFCNGDLADVISTWLWCHNCCVIKYCQWFVWTCFVFWLWVFNQHFFSSFKILLNLFRSCYYL